MQLTKSKWSVVCGFSGDIYSGHRTQAAAEKRADEIRQSLLWPNITGRLRENADKAQDETHKNLRYDGENLQIGGKNVRCPPYSDCGALVAYVQVVPAGSYFSREADKVGWVVPTAGEDVTA